MRLTNHTRSQYANNFLPTNHLPPVVQWAGQLSRQTEIFRTWLKLARYEESDYKLYLALLVTAAGWDI